MKENCPCIHRSWKTALSCRWHRHVHASKTGAPGDLPSPGYQREMHIVLLKADNIYNFFKYSNIILRDTTIKSDPYGSCFLLGFRRIPAPESSLSGMSLTAMSGAKSRGGSGFPSGFSSYRHRPHFLHHLGTFLSSDTIHQNTLSHEKNRSWTGGKKYPPTE